eukprot:CAMPEP_0185839334 /NCGR_PEP_ID=MMETSP1353-20130828/14425_1 /TAXON_ID=1077150 /ORGANISM="Erythrolobus australicus, Strain CCMP3124" /LENGTH=328 /DNA_ID=CAMNT_0028538481 /DNA_START=1 /DNA_END=984 /DNA_ORIENTATION=-
MPSKLTFDSRSSPESDAPLQQSALFQSSLLGGPLGPESSGGDWAVPADVYGLAVPYSPQYTSLAHGQLGTFAPTMITASDIERWVLDSAAVEKLEIESGAQISLDQDRLMRAQPEPILSASSGDQAGAALMGILKKGNHSAAADSVKHENIDQNAVCKSVQNLPSERKPKVGEARSRVRKGKKANVLVVDGQAFFAALRAPEACTSRIPGDANAATSLVSSSAQRTVQPEAHSDLPVKTSMEPKSLDPDTAFFLGLQQHDTGSTSEVSSSFATKNPAAESAEADRINKSRRSEKRGGRRSGQKPTVKEQAATRAPTEAPSLANADAKT